MSDERRRLEARIGINQEFDAFEGIIDEYVTNLSRSGAFVRTRAAIPVGARVNLHFTVLHEDMETVTGVGEVVRVQNDPPGVGVVFSELAPDSAAVIERMLARRNAG